MTRLRILLPVIAVLALLVPASNAGAGPVAKTSGEELVFYVTAGKLKVERRISYIVACGAPVGSSCQMDISAKIKGAKSRRVRFAPLEATLTVPAGDGVEVFFSQISKAGRRAINKSKKAKLVTEVTATNLTTGEVDADSQNFRFK